MSIVIAHDIFLKDCQFYLIKLFLVKCPLMHFYEWTQNKPMPADEGEQNVVFSGNPGRFHF